MDCRVKPLAGTSFRLAAGEAKLRREPGNDAEGVGMNGQIGLYATPLRASSVLRWQLAQWPGATSLSVGVSTRQRSTA
jgi:hypothetical protein